jgi:GxxExxY protein
MCLRDEVPQLGARPPEEDLTREIIGVFFYVYNTLGHGFLESVYARALEEVLARTGHHVAREVRVPVWFERQTIGYHRLDLLVDHKVVIEVKATERLPDIAMRQLRSYLNATRLDVGLVLHFGLKASAHRVRPRPSRAEQFVETDPTNPPNPNDPCSS